MIDAGLLLLRGVSGGLLAGHGAQKTFGAFEGPGPEGTRGIMKMLRMQPPHVWGHAAGLSELVGGGLTALGALNPIGPLVACAPMLVATTTVHWGKPVWATKGGPELPLVNLASFLAVAMAGPGRWSVDGLLGIRVPRWMVGLTAAGVVGGTALALATRGAEEPAAQGQPAEQPAGVGEAAAAAAAASDEREVELQAERQPARSRRVPQQG
ncbi:MAG TPA: DoxX family protein [Candidatus Dormibacteraeota bacterium]|nr:DoxX family protein [Candidatus Dormibacteraeota bacterium]